MLVGVPCSGKSTYSERLKYIHMSRAVIASSDEYLVWLANRHGTTYNDIFSDMISVAQRHANDVVNLAVKNGLNIIWDQTNLTVKSRAKKLKKIPKEYRKIALVFEHTQKVIFERNNLRNRSCSGKIIGTKTLTELMSTYTCPDVSEGFDIVIKNDDLQCTKLMTYLQNQ